MIENFSLALLLLFASYHLIKPFFIDVILSSDTEKNILEKKDLLRLLQSLEFDLARGLIPEADYLKQKEKAQKRLQKLSVEDQR